jgi:hypothetical protein
VTGIIRTSDRSFFKRCRVLWDFTSKIRQNWEPLQRIDALDFGTAMHEALQAYYEPTTWGNQGLQEQNALRAFFISADKVGARVKLGALEFEDRWKELRVLGEGMLNHYFMWAPKRDNFTPIFTEVEFEVPIPGMHGDVMYQGRIDLIIQDEFGYWIVDHKTTAQLADTQWLWLDDQCSSYAWAIQKQLGLNIRGVIYNELRKKAPRKPNVLMNGTLSVNKSQDTTYEVYLQTVRELGYKPKAYAGILSYLKENPKEFVRRTKVNFTPKALAVVEGRIQTEAIEMLSWGKSTPVAIYPTPSRFNCNGCSFFGPCTALHDGYDPLTILNERYEQRKKDA